MTDESDRPAAPPSDPRGVALAWTERAWNAARVAEVAELIHDAHPIGAAGVVASFRRLHALVLDVEASIERQLVDGNQVATQLKVTGSWRGEPVGWDAVYIHVVRDGKIADFAAISSAPDFDDGHGRGSE